jgi:calmodulin
MDGEQPVD